MKVSFSAFVVLVMLALAPSGQGSSRDGRRTLRPAALFPRGPTLDRADVLVCIDINDHVGFADLTMRYVDAFVGAGAQSIATCGVEEPYGLIEFPPEVTADNYPIVVVLTSENWWAEAGSNIDPEDEAVLADYLETGGNLLLVGQDYMRGAHPDMNGDAHPCYGFPREFLGLDVCYQDVAYNPPDPAPETATITGSDGWLFESESVSLDASSVFLDNNFYADCAVPVETGGCAFAYKEAEIDGAVVYNEARGFRTVWAGIEISAAPVEDFHRIVASICEWFGPCPVEEASWGRIKSLFR